MHAASVGETNAILPLIEGILEANPHIHVLLTTGTTTSADIAARRLPANGPSTSTFRSTFRNTSRAFSITGSRRFPIFTESDIWPNLVLGTAERQIPLVLVNASMSPRSISRWRRYAKIGRPLFSRFAVVLAQNPQIARAIKRLGAPNVITAGNLKIDSPPPPVDAAALAALKSAVGERPVFLAASTHPGEDTVIAAAHTLMRRDIEGLLTIIVPRHPERGGGLAATLGGLGLKTQLAHPLADAGTETEIYVADTIGELGNVLRDCARCSCRWLARRARRTKPHRSRPSRRLRPDRTVHSQFSRRLCVAVSRRRSDRSALVRRYRAAGHDAPRRPARREAHARRCRSGTAIARRRTWQKRSAPSSRCSRSRGC